MAKNIVICCDGTGNEFGASKSNVVKLYEMLVHDDSQVTYYHPGVGTMGARSALTGITRWWTKVIGLAFGYGISDNIADAYQFLMRTFQPNDKVYIFGFSRGAYTARALCGMLHIIGLLREDNEGLIPYAIRMIKQRKIDFAIANDFNKTFCRDCKPHFVGVWDTVSSVGWVYNVAHFPGTKATHNPDLRIIRHAVSIDERRAFFRQNLFGEPHDEKQDIKEIWFPGVHSDVGGSYPEAESQLSKIALQWMVCEAEPAGLQVDQNRKADILGAMPPYVGPDALTKNQHESLNGWWWIAELWPKIFSYPVRVEGRAEPEWKHGIRLNLGGSRKIPEGVHVHQSVDDRIRGVPGYRPKNLPQHLTEPATSCELAPRPGHGQPIAPPPKRPMLRRPSVIGTLALLVVVGACAAVIALFAILNSLEVPKIERPKEVAWLAQNWTEDQRRRYYHTAQGSELLPYAWFLALEQPRFTFKGAPPFRENTYMQGFGFIPDSIGLENPDGLPVGFVRDDRFTDPYTGQKNVVLGITCGACHTGELFFRGKAIRIDAGPSLIDLQKFTEALGLAVTWTYYDPLRFHRFARNVLGPNHSNADRVLLRRALKYYLDTSFTEFKANRHLFPTPEGYGRTDALARIGNFVFGTELNNNRNLVIGDAPVNFPPVWDASWMDWVQYNGSIQQPMGRNVGEGLGVRSRINLLGYPGQQFQNTIHVDNLHEIELLLGGSEPGMGVWSPKWPEDILGKIDRDAALKGEKLYNELCLHCHQSPMLSEAGSRAEHWTNNTNTAGRRFFKVTMIPLAEIGTDPKEAQNFHDRTADSGPLGKGIVSARDGLKYITQKLIDQSYADLKLPPEQQLQWNGYRENELRSPLAYKARPHNGIWATPPYLHNGSVPNLFALLSPVSERPKIFYLGNKQYDPVKLGLNTDPLEGASKFRTDMPGNSNVGHEFNDGPKGNGVIGRKLSPEERMQIIEYLKTL